MTLAFAPPAVATATPVPEATNPPVRAAMPAFSPWKGSTLDIRPACWSLRNRPEEWNYNEGSTFHAHAYVKHERSEHRFKVGFGPWLWGQIYAYCSCRTRVTQRLTLTQRLQFRAAYKHWRRNYYLPAQRAQRVTTLANTNQHFRSHFTTT